MKSVQKSHNSTPSCKDYANSEQARSDRYAHVRRMCIRKEHYPPDIIKTSQERQVDAEKYSATVTKTAWEQDLARFLLYGSRAGVFRETDFCKLGLVQQKAWVYTHQRTTECERMDCEFEEEVLLKIKAMDEEMVGIH